MKSEGLFEWQGGPIILTQVCLQLISFDMYWHHPFECNPPLDSDCPCRLRMSLGPWSGIRESPPRPTRHGQLTWQLHSTQVFHGSCAKKMMPRIQLYVLYSLSLRVQLGQDFFNVLGSELVSIFQERKLMIDHTPMLDGLLFSSSPFSFNKNLLWSNGCRLILATDFIVTGSPQTNLTSLPCGLRLGHPGNLVCFLFLT